MQNLMVIAMETEKDKQKIQVDINDIDPDEGLRLSFEHPLDGFFPEGEEVVGIAPARVDLNITKYDIDIYVSGNIKGAIKMVCGRCLAYYRQEIEVELKAHFFPREEGTDSDELNAYDGDTLDLYPLLHDQILMAVPFKPLCNDNCKGLCSRCGADLNKEKCGCPAREIDGRLAVLKKLKEKI